ncbi:MAG: iron-sulfur cluster assembly scaffold protein [Alphaproteobacteria bacterium]|nr:iron-sulfur cluster assembly scaffold protein [Alphaproteobacteria bacterium]MBV9692607.1 iron-sulfur cluster assembly scaffold protein [Alphaproteobacteria bacterium]
MSDPLYKKPLLRLAADAAGAGRLPQPCVTGTAHNPACGDRVIVDIALEADRIIGIGLETKACVLTQASASILGSGAVGLNRDEIVSLRDAVRLMLSGGADPPHAPFECYAHFDGVAEHKNRHRCVLLPIEAVLAAFGET